MATFHDHTQFTGAATYWDDLVMPLTSGKLGANSLPHYDYTNNGYLFPNNDATEILYLIAQLPHSYKHGSTIQPHLHWQQSADQVVGWKLDYKWFNIGAAVPADFVTLALDTLVNAYSAGNLHQISYNTSGIAGTGKTMSSLLLMKLYRNDATYTGDALAFQLDIHYEADSLGSNSEYTKL